MKKVNILLFAFLLLIIGATSANAAEKDYFTKLTLSGDEFIHIKTQKPLSLMSITKAAYGKAEDTRYVYRIQNLKTLSNYIVITKRQLPNGDYFLFTEVKNRTDEAVNVELLLNKYGISDSNLASFDRYPVKHSDSPSAGYDPTTYPVGLLTLNSEGQLAENLMIGKAYYSRELTQTYENGSQSSVRELIKEEDPFTLQDLGSRQLLTVTLKSAGNDIIDHWILLTKEPLFENERNLNRWMQESAVNYRKTNAWYTENGPYNKMAETIEPLPKSKLGYGRTLLMLKEDRALELYKQNGDRYFYDLIHNSLANLDKFKGDKQYWQTEVTSTYLKNLFGITAPFIDTRFNEQTALFLKGVGETLGIEGLDQAFYDYADLLVFQAETNHIIKVGEDGYFIPDYFAVNQDVMTHMSLNHGLGGMNLLLEAYLDSGNEKYLETARKIQIGLEIEGDKWIRENEDLWYKVNPDLTYVGTDYTYLTLLDLLKTYSLWEEVDPDHNVFIEKMIRSKASYLKNHNLSLTLTLKNHLRANGFEELIF